MKEYKSKPTKKNNIRYIHPPCKKTNKGYSKWIKLTAVSFIAFLSINFFYHEWKLAQINRQIKQVEEQYNAEKKENQQLKATVGQLNNKEYIAKIAREKLGLIKKGEKVYRISE